MMYQFLEYFSVVLSSMLDFIVGEISEYLDKLTDIAFSLTTRVKIILIAEDQSRPYSLKTSVACFLDLPVISNLRSLS